MGICEARACGLPDTSTKVFQSALASSVQPTVEIAQALTDNLVGNAGNRPLLGLVTERPYLRRLCRLASLNRQFLPLRSEVPCQLRRVHSLCLVSPLGRYGSQLTEEVP